MEEPGVAVEHHGAGEPGARDLGVDQPAVRVHPGEEAAVLVVGDLVLDEDDLRPGRQQPLEDGGRVPREALSRLAVPGLLGCVDVEEAHPGGLAVEGDADRVAVVHVLDDGGAAVGLRGLPGAVEGAEEVEEQGREEDEGSQRGETDEQRRDVKRVVRMARCPDPLWKRTRTMYCD